MAFPAVVNTNQTLGTTATLTPAINLPGSLVAGNLLIILFQATNDNNTVGVSSSGFTIFAQNANPTTGQEATVLAYKVSTGSEGATVNAYCYIVAEPG